MDHHFTRTVGSRYANGTCLFTVWAPFADQVQLLIKGQDKPLDMVKDRFGYWEKEIKDSFPGTKYMFLLDNNLQRPDPASSYQPEGVHSWSEVIDHQAYQWTDASWKTPALEDMIIYELHVGTFTEEGTFEAVVDKLDHLTELGVNAIEIMPIAQFPGNRNWGYDGTLLFVSHDRYFIEKFAERIWALEDGEIRDYKCGYAKYRSILEHEAMMKPVAPAAAKPKKEKPKGGTKEIDKLIRRLEREIEKQENLVAELDKKIEGSGADYQELTRLLEEKEEAELLLMELMEQWETAQESVET